METTKSKYYLAGYDAGLNKPTKENCSIFLFDTEEHRKEWERGNEQGKKDKAQKNNCPNCNYNFDTHSEINDKKIKPVKGDFSICINCGEFLEFDKDLKPFIIGYDQLKNADSKEVAKLMAYQIEIKLRGRLK